MSLISELTNKIMLNWPTSLVLLCLRGWWNETQKTEGWFWNPISHLGIKLVISLSEWLNWISLKGSAGVTRWDRLRVSYHQTSIQQGVDDTRLIIFETLDFLELFLSLDLLTCIDQSAQICFRYQAKLQDKSETVWRSLDIEIVNLFHCGMEIKVER